MRVFNVTGYVVSDAERKIGKNGKEFITFRMVNSDFGGEKDASGKPKPYWFRVTSFNNSRHFGMAQYLTKGKPVIVYGDYSDSIYQNKEGVCDISREILASAIYFNDVSNKNSNSTNGTGTPTETVVTQTKIESPKPTTDELKIPQSSSTGATDDDDDLPF